MAWHAVIVAVNAVVETIRQIQQCDVLAHIIRSVFGQRELRTQHSRRATDFARLSWLLAFGKRPGVRCNDRGLEVVLAKRVHKPIR